MRLFPVFDSAIVTSISPFSVQRLDVAVRVQPLVLSLGAQRLGVATSKVTPLGDRRHPTIEASFYYSAYYYYYYSARCDRSCKQTVIVFVIALVIVLWDRNHLRSLPPYFSSTMLLCARMRTGTL